MSHLYNNASAKSRRRDLRKNQSDAEKKLWTILRNKRTHDLKFFRQYGAGPYILDFYCPTFRLAIELDGGQHGEDGQKAYDERRTAYLQQYDIRVLRFWNNEVLKNFETVMEKINDAIHNPS